MRIHIAGTNKVYKVTLREWNGCGYDPDLFDELETNVPHDFPVDCEGDWNDCDAEMTRDDFDAVVDWWRGEVKAYHNGEKSFFGDPDDEFFETDRDRRSDLKLFVDEIA